MFNIKINFQIIKCIIMKICLRFRIRNMHVCIAKILHLNIELKA